MGKQVAGIDGSTENLSQPSETPADVKMDMVNMAHLQIETKLPQISEPQEAMPQATEGNNSMENHVSEALSAPLKAHNILPQMNKIANPSAIPDTDIASQNSSATIIDTSSKTKHSPDSSTNDPSQYWLVFVKELQEKEIEPMRLSRVVRYICDQFLIREQDQNTQIPIQKETTEESNDQSSPTIQKGKGTKRKSSHLDKGSNESDVPVERASKCPRKLRSSDNLVADTPKDSSRHNHDEISHLQSQLSKKDKELLDLGKEVVNLESKQCNLIDMNSKTRNGNERLKVKIRELKDMLDAFKAAQATPNSPPNFLLTKLNDNDLRIEEQRAQILQMRSRVPYETDQDVVRQVLAMFKKAKDLENKLFGMFEGKPKLKKIFPPVPQRSLPANQLFWSHVRTGSLIIRLLYALASKLGFKSEIGLQKLLGTDAQAYNTMTLKLKKKLYQQGSKSNLE
jgi:hypothetical protein